MKMRIGKLFLTLLAALWLGCFLLAGAAAGCTWKASLH